jgi:type IV pilus assembly protein PilQ
MIDLLFPPDIPDSPKGRIQVGTLENDNFEIILEALETEGNGSLLNTPRLAVLDRETARIQVAVDQPFVESLSDANSDVTRQSTRFIPVGVTLEVIPFIDNADEVTLEVRVEVSSLQGTAANGAPIVDRTEAVSKIRVRDRHTLAIGGLIAWETLETKNKVPFLGDIPVLGHAFKNSHSELSESELIVFITPHIVGTGDSAAPPEKLEISARQPAHG